MLIYELKEPDESDEKNKPNHRRRSPLHKRLNGVFTPNRFGLGFWIVLSYLLCVASRYVINVGILIPLHHIVFWISQATEYIVVAFLCLAVLGLGRISRKQVEYLFGISACFAALMIVDFLKIAFGVFVLKEYVS